MINLFIFAENGTIDGVYSFYETDNDAETMISGIISDLEVGKRYAVLTDEEVDNIVSPYEEDEIARFYIEIDEQGDVYFNETRYLERKEAAEGSN